MHILFVALVLLLTSCSNSTDTSIPSTTTTSTSSTSTSTTTSTTSTTIPPLPSGLNLALDSCKKSPIETSVALYTPDFKKVIASDNNSYYNASTVKLAILEALVFQAQESNQPLSDATRNLASKMISISDNNSATQLYAKIGGPSGLKNYVTKVGATTMQPSSSWGLTRATALDYIAIVNAFSWSNDVLTNSSRELIKDLLREVVPSQDWGISASPATAALLKNGWLPYQGVWYVHSVGQVTLQTKTYTLAILTKNAPSQAQGIAQIESCANTIYKAIS